MSTPTPINARKQPLGTYRAISCRDAASLERDGQHYYGLNTLTSRAGEAQVEVQFADGVWVLADPERDLHNA